MPALVNQPKATQNKLYVLPQNILEKLCAHAKKQHNEKEKNVCFFFWIFGQSVRASWGKTYNLFWVA